MKHFAVRLALLPVFFLIIFTANAAGRYDLDTGYVSFQCVSFMAGPYYWRNYTMTISPQSNGGFTFASFKEVLTANQCDTVFDVYSKKLVGEGRVADDIYSVELLYDSESTIFTFASAEYLRTSETALWVVSNGVNELYLGGTIHVLRESDFPLHSAFLQAYELAETVVFEYDPAVGITGSDLEGFNLPPGESLLDYMSVGIELFFDDYLQQFGRTLNDYSRKKPRFFNTDLYYLGARSYGYYSGVDSYFMELAKTDGKRTGGLETVGEQITALVESSDDTNVDWDRTFIQRLGYIESGLIDQDLSKLIGEWREGKMEWMSVGNESYQMFFPRQYESILANRNRNWIPVIESYLDTPETEFILAGFSHFAGPDNVLELLEELGYSVEKFVIYESPFNRLKVDVNLDISLFDERK